MEKSKRDVKPSAFAISLRQNGSLFPFTRREYRIRVFDLTVMGEQGLNVSHTFPRLCCTEGA
jgi:hypothetical protein